MLINNVFLIDLLNVAMEEDNTREALSPVPKPRRHLLLDSELANKSSYENVSIDLINKTIDIKNENLQNNSKNKLPLNKTFLVPTPDAHMINVLTEMNDLQTTIAKDTNKNATVQLDEVNNLSCIYNDTNIDEIQKKPVPAPRRSHTNTSNKVDKLPSPSTSGAVSRLENNSCDSIPYKGRSGSYSLVHNEASINENVNEKASLQKTPSNSSLASTHSGNSNTEGSKYQKTPPG